jgi:lipopolysaccharide biosynthesis regulator YciM
MEFDISFLLLALPIAFVLGWMASRWDVRQLRFENKQAPKAYFKGLNFLLNEQQDQAIDAFIEAVQIDPDTSELHFALGNLFRRRGEYERAVRVHQHLLSRTDLSEDDRHRAQYELALDYLKAGLLDRAETALHLLENTRFEGQALLVLLANYERSRDWEHAATIARKLESYGLGSFKNRLAHYLCEQATGCITLAHSSDGYAQAMNYLKQAIQIAPDAARPRMDKAQLQNRQGKPDLAYETLASAVVTAPTAIALIASPLAQYAIFSKQVARALVLLKEVYADIPSLDVLDAIVTLEAASGAPSASARDWYVRHLENEPSLVAATKWIAGEKLEHEQFHPQVQRALDHAVKPLTRYRCAACGFEAKRHFWQCPGCQAWDSYPARRVEEL